MIILSVNDCQNNQDSLSLEQIDLDKLELLSLKQSIKMNKSYIKMCQQSIEDLLKISKPKDRLEAGVAIELIINYMNISLIGWKEWCNLKGMNIITNKEFKEIVPKLTKLALNWIKIDEKITITKTKDLENELEQILKETKNEKLPYIE